MFVCAHARQAVALESNNGFLKKAALQTQPRPVALRARGRGAKACQGGRERERRAGQGRFLACAGAGVTGPWCACASNTQGIIAFEISYVTLDTRDLVLTRAELTHLVTAW